MKVWITKCAPAKGIIEAKSLNLRGHGEITKLEAMMFDEPTSQHIDADRTVGLTDWDRECQESGRLNRR